VEIEHKHKQEDGDSKTNEMSAFETSCHNNIVELVGCFGQNCREPMECIIQEQIAKIDDRSRFNFSNTHRQKIRKIIRT
jgi:hypothetical protein